MIDISSTTNAKMNMRKSTFAGIYKTETFVNKANGAHTSFSDYSLLPSALPNFPNGQIKGP
ncbi:hypothetical protein [Marivirga sp.]|uniref:hypothetical protein n=1 Tax=Marivirga sp. TaxID=2018662 RepID=UPI003DA77901